MRQTPILEFESSAFAVIPGEDGNTNPEIFGKALAEWLAEQLRKTGLPAGSVISEDFGWCVPVETESHSLFVACASAGEGPDHWQVFAFAEGGLVARVFGRDESAVALAELFAAVRHALESTPAVRGLREQVP